MNWISSPEENSIHTSIILKQIAVPLRLHFLLLRRIFSQQLVAPWTATPPTNLLFDIRIELPKDAGWDSIDVYFNLATPIKFVQCIVVFLCHSLRV